jgi:hypothetical protein
VTLGGAIFEVQAFGNNVPTGLAMHDDTTFMAFAGPVPHPREGSGVASFHWDAKSCRDRRPYVLSQGVGVPGAIDGAPAQPDTGQLLRLRRDGSSTVVVDSLDRPTSLEFLGTTAFVVTLAGEVWRIPGMPCAVVGGRG